MPAIVSSSSLSGVTVPEMMGSARKPSSVISLTNEFGVHKDCTLPRDTPGRNITACVTSYRRVRPLRVQILPLRARTTIVSRLAPSRSSRYCLKVSMYSWPTGICFSKPASMRSCSANQPITAVSATSTPITTARWWNSTVSSHCKLRSSIDVSERASEESVDGVMAGLVCKCRVKARTRSRAAGALARDCSPRPACRLDQKLRDSTAPKNARSPRG